MNDIKSLSNSKWRCKYHIVFAQSTGDRYFFNTLWKWLKDIGIYAARRFRELFTSRKNNQSKIFDSLEYKTEADTLKVTYKNIDN